MNHSPTTQKNEQLHAKSRGAPLNCMSVLFH